MKIFVCGPIAFGGVEEIRRLQKILEREMFEVIDQFQSKEMDYSGVKDFRGDRRLAQAIVSNDLSLIEGSDLIVAICNKPSFGTAIEIYYAKMSGKKVIVLNEVEQPSPWPIAFADAVVEDVGSLINVLKKML